MKEQGVGASLPRKEDDRFLRGRGEYVADIRMAGMKDVAFLRSPLAHARVRGVHVPNAVRGQVFCAQDLKGVRPIVAVSGRGASSRASTARSGPSVVPGSS